MSARGCHPTRRQARIFQVGERSTVRPDRRTVGIEEDTVGLSQQIRVPDVLLGIVEMLLARDFLPEDEEMRFAGLRVVAIWTAPWDAT